MWTFLLECRAFWNDNASWGDCVTSSFRFKDPYCCWIGTCRRWITWTIGVLYFGVAHSSPVSTMRTAHDCLLLYLLLWQPSRHSILPIIDLTIAIWPHLLLCTVAWLFIVHIILWWYYHSFDHWLLLLRVFLVRIDWSGVWRLRICTHIHHQAVEQCDIWLVLSKIGV